jgi:pimeloyl-ACP methyl ester carboxylesterase
MTTTDSPMGAADFDATSGLVPRRIQLTDVTLSVLEAGVGGEPLMLVHGFTGAKEDFAAEVVRLADLGFHVVAPDHRGHGDSDHPDTEDAYSFETFAADLIELAGALGWQTFDLLGHSMGGMVVQHLALSHPHRITRLVLMDTHHGPVGGLDEQLLELGIQLARTQGLGIIQEVIKLGRDPLASPAHTRLCEEVPGFEEWSDAKFLRASPLMFASMLRRFSETPDRLADLSTVACPTLVVVGELDEPFRAPSQAMADVIEGARLVVIPGGGHSPQLESPEHWRAAVDEFLLDDFLVDDQDEAVA